MSIITDCPLPALDSQRVDGLRLGDIPNCCTAYNRILEAELTALRQKEKANIIAARVVGYLLLEFRAQANILDDTPCATLVSWVTAPPQDVSDTRADVIFKVGRLSHDKFIRLFRTSNVQYQPPSSRPSCPAFDTLEDMIKDSMEVTCEDHRTSRKKALARDGYRCMITGVLDLTSVSNCVELATVARRDCIVKTRVETAHILNESVMQGIDPPGISESSAVVNKAHYAAGAMAMLAMFGFSEFTEAFTQSGGVHQVWNLLSLEHNFHLWFDRLDLWFERTKQPNHYNICLSDPAIEKHLRTSSVGRKTHLESAPIVVDFSPELNQLPPPHPILLDLHATCARVAHMSGAAEFLDKLEWDAEETRVLAFDGTSATLLSDLLSPYSLIDGIA